jgi:hypothetical protein
MCAYLQELALLDEHSSSAPVRATVRPAAEPNALTQSKVVRYLPRGQLIAKQMMQKGAKYDGFLTDTGR